MKPKLGNLNYKYRIFCYILVVTLIPIITLGFYSYHTYITELSDKIQASNDAAVNQVKSRVDTVFINIRKNYIEAVEEEELKWLLKEEIWYSDYTKLVKAGNTLRGPDYYAEYIEGYTFLNFNTDWVLSNRGMYKYELVKNKKEVTEVYNSNGNSLINNFWITRLTTKVDTLSRETVNLRNISLVLKLPLIQKNPYGMLIININMNKMIKVLNEDLAGGDITVLDYSGKLIYTSNKEVANSCLLQMEKLPLESIEKLKSESGKEYSMAVKKSEAMDWVYIVSYDRENIRDGGETILSITFLMLSIIVFILILAVVFTHRLYTPVFQLAKYVTILSPNKENDTMHNEFDFIAKKIDSLVDNKAILEKLIVSQQPQLLELFQLRLIRGEMKEDQIAVYLDKLKINKKKYYMVMTINLKSQNSLEAYDEAKQDVLRINTTENMPESVLKELLMPPVCNARIISCAVSAENTKELDGKIMSVYTQLDEFVHDTYNFHISMGVSSASEELKDFRNAYQESIEALKGNEIFNKKNFAQHNELMFYSDITTKESGYSYERILEREVKEAVDTGDKAKAFEVVDNFIDSLIEHNVLKNDMSFSLHRFMIGILLVATDAGLQINHLFDNDLSNMLLKFNQIYDMDKVRSFIKYKVVITIINQLEEFRTSRSSEIMKDIQDLIEVSQGDITLTECAERLNYHPTYIWKVMKMEKNTTFSNYVGEYKLEEAKKLLLETDYTVLEIASLLKYTNSQNFIRFFSKLEGITPGKYRQMNKKFRPIDLNHL